MDIRPLYESCLSSSLSVERRRTQASTEKNGEVFLPPDLGPKFSPLSLSTSLLYFFFLVSLRGVSYLNVFFS